ncbi:glycosyltransferase [Hymenobacter jejuensis]|uniref:glycosyltransferase n=1 Tax=Hymenobacter jejuensis TaxID=2502781 RepID=UPI001E349012|nr:glycosyltransferase [Hymenobacter jejuensis]
MSIVALCYNHARFLPEALDSILAQSYPNLEVLLVDAASTDGSVSILRQYAAQNPTWKTIFLPHNVGNCAGFNQGFRQSSGAFLIDFATDDVLLPDRVAQQVAAFQTHGDTCGVIYSDAELIDEESRHVRYHFGRDGRGHLHPEPASGDVFAAVLRRYFISSPTMLIRRQVLERLGGYDESLAYEDFDFWVRASRDYEFQFLDVVTTKKRLHPQAMSRKGYRPHDPYLASTIRVCQKARALCRTPAERAALVVRLRWEHRQAVRWRNYQGANKLYEMLKTEQAIQPLDWVLHLWSKINYR